MILSIARRVVEEYGCGSIRSRKFLFVGSPLLMLFCLFDLKFLTRLGVPEKWQIVDVLSLDPDMLGMIPRPALALILLFPTSPKVNEYFTFIPLKVLCNGDYWNIHLSFNSLFF